MKTKEEKREYAREYYKANKESVLARQNAYNRDNRDLVNAQGKARYKKNHAQIRARINARIAGLRDDFYTMYYLPEEHYIGITNCPKKRIELHKYQRNNTEGWEVVYTFKTKRDALDMERKFHEELGYNGKNASY
tara:strand:+ start:85 stop:489 length:405 start_codon:yes stop_codon:yes gene_type:complete